MFDIGFWELLVIGVMALLVLGPERLPGAIRSTARTIRRVKNIAGGFKAEIDEQLRIHELHENLKKAEAMSMHNLSPELQKTVDELKAAAASVQQPYKKNTESEGTPENTIADPAIANKSKPDDSTRE
ncbi:Sec-independent protein translocase protein TatB [Alteromonas sp. ASW11-36]|uniref:Sec-independent protein translocase protein TatB n=1 Tax=Alteromonas arenosi TaxID=3055817 RepID=A0ABT7SZF2_9ALTE|nr:Sec-independent protein translocase protein TatB [Alteromonas sp. ASW11-36]MDM7861568.1 Sec-independent protein translocase protein TatB [Alteromonas sp. ASW11-36]